MSEIKTVRSISVAGAPLSAPRSGDQVLNTTVVIGLLVAILSPFTAAAIQWIQGHTNIVFGDGYQTQLETVIGIGIPWAAAKLHMRRIRIETQGQAVGAAPSDGV